MFSFDGFVRLNAFLRDVYRMAWLNVLWTAVTLLGLVVVGFGPASYAMAKYVDRWFRLGETPPVTRTFLRYCLEQRWRPVLVGWILLGAGAVIGVNLTTIEDGYLRTLNILVLGVLGVMAAYVFFVLAALDVDTIPRQLASAVLIGFGSLHLTIIAATATGVTGWLLMRYAPLLLLVFGIGIPMTAAGLVVRRAFRELAPSARAEHTTTDIGRRRLANHLANHGVRVPVASDPRPAPSNPSDSREVPAP